MLTLSGLFSVLSYLVEQRAKDIGVRMALGATTRNVAQLVLSQSLRPVSIGLVVGGGLAAALATVLMATPAASAIGSVVHVFDPVGVRREPAGHCHILRAGRIGSRLARRPHRSDRDAQKGLKPCDA